MRLLTSLPEQEPAMRLVAYLAVEGVQTTLEEDDGSWEIWVHHDDDRDQSKSILEAFQQDPNHERYVKAERKVRNTLKEVDRIVEQKQKLEDRLKKRWSGSWWHCYPATYILIALCILVVLVSSKPAAPRGMMLLPLCNKQDSALLQKLTILPEHRSPDVANQALREMLGVKNPKVQFSNPEALDDLLAARPNKPPIEAITKGADNFYILKMRAVAGLLWHTLASGEFWRPLTPAFIHFGLLHIVFNMMLFKNLGETVEYERGTTKFLLLCLMIGGVSNLAQLYWAGPNFGGMSGVVFGLIGYVWMKGKTQPQHGIRMTHQSITFAILWLLLCMTGTLGAIANGAHLVGFLTGIVIGARQFIYKKLPFIN